LTFISSDTEFKITKLVEVWTAVAQCMIDANGDSDKLTACGSAFMDQVSVTIAGDCLTCVSGFMTLRAADIDQCRNDCMNNGIESTQCSDCANPLAVDIGQACLLFDPVIPPTCDGSTFQELSFSSNSVDYVATNIKEIFIQQALCEEAANGDDILRDECRSTLGANMATLTTADCQACLTSFVDDNSLEVASCYTYCSSSGSPESCDNCSDVLRDDFMIKCLLADVPPPPETSTTSEETTEESTTEPPIVENCAGETFIPFQWTVRGETFQASDLTSVWIEGAKCVQAGNPFQNCMMSLLIAMPRTVLGEGCSNCLENFAYSNTEQILSCAAACNSESGCNGCELDLTSSIMTTCSIEDLVPEETTTTAEASGSAGLTMTLALIAGAMAMVVV